jgi:hypothetical protein
MVMVHDSFGNGLKKLVERGCLYEVETHKWAPVKVLRQSSSCVFFQLLELLLRGLIGSSETPMLDARKNIGLHVYDNVEIKGRPIILAWL